MNGLSVDTLTVLIAAEGKRATKIFTRHKDGKVTNRNYDHLKFFAVESVQVTGIKSLADAVDRIARNPRAAIIRGSPLPGINKQHTRRKLKPDPKTGEEATFKEEPRHWFVFDIDHIARPALTDPATDPEGAVEYAIGLLPPEFHDAWCYWQFSSSQSVFPDDDTLSMHLWFWSDQPLDNVELKRWAIATNKVAGKKLIDTALFNAVQVHYTARPAFNAMQDPLWRRSGLREALDESVSLLIPPPDPKRPDTPSAAGYEPGSGVESYIAEIGGARGFRDPIKSAIGSYVAIYSSKADAEPLKELIRDAIDRGDPGGRQSEQIERYRSDEYLDDLIDWTRQQHGDQPPKGFLCDPPARIVDPEIPSATQDAALPAEGTIIRVTAGKRHDAADQGLAAMHAAGVAFYRRDRGLVRVCLIKAKNTDGRVIFVPGILPVTTAMLCRALGQSAYWEKINSRRELVRIDPPDKIVEQITGMIDEWPFPPLTGVITCPTLRPDGSLLQAQGYDIATGLVLYNTIAMPPVPEFPSPEDVEAAVLLLSDLLSEFPFANDASLSVALSQLMTPVLRGAFPVAPMHLTNAPEAGTGKSYLADITSAIPTGERCAVISVAPNPEETEKRLVGAALAGYPIIALDNVRQLLQGDFLCQVTERPLLQLRRLGSSDQPRVANTFTPLANGNNATVADDLVRRTICCTLDANMESPEKRTFSTNPMAMVMRNRGAYIAAPLTIARAYIAAGKPDCLPPLASYEGWSDLVRSSLVWLGFPDPVDTMESARGADPIRQDPVGLNSVLSEIVNVNRPDIPQSSNHGAIRL
jgi:hypothetical protein